MLGTAVVEPACFNWYSFKPVSQDDDILALVFKMKPTSCPFDTLAFGLFLKVFDVIVYVLFNDFECLMM